MKPAPLQLKWVNYPAAFYEVIGDFSGGIDVATPAIVEHAEVNYSLTGEHYALLKITSNHSEKSVPYKFSVTAATAFTFDLDIAKREYRPSTPDRLTSIIAVNVARVLFSGAREHIAMMTARATFGSTYLESQLLEPSDVSITSDADPEEILSTIFQLSQEELEVVRERVRRHVAAAQNAAVATDSKPAKRPRASKG